MSCNHEGYIERIKTMNAMDLYYELCKEYPGMSDIIHMAIYDVPNIGGVDLKLKVEVCINCGYIKDEISELRDKVVEEIKEKIHRRKIAIEIYERSRKEREEQRD